jgi:uncharacterized protein YecE (DUF72 family)
MRSEVRRTIFELTRWPDMETIRRRIGTAGWAIPRAEAEHFLTEGTGLERYAAQFDAVEINSTFYRSHRATTYARWVALTPDHFRFAVKLSRTITHEARLVDTGPLLEVFRAEAVQLREKLGPLLVQLPPSLALERAVAERFFAELRDRWPGPIVCEPRHPTWFETEAEALLSAFHVARAAADPARHAAAGEPGGWRGLSYWRLHGSPRMYYSRYEDDALCRLAAAIGAAPGEAWCVFDNTTSGAAAGDALRLAAMVNALQH